MICINRPPAPAFLTDIQGLWYAETQSAIAHYAVAGQAEDFKFDRYNHADVKTALRAVFGTKCVYCESKYASGSDGDIEHFRPKGRVEGKTPDKPGYYWLANDWDNLLLACQHCNQSRRHLLGSDNSALLNDGKSKGKLDKFPLSDPLLRVTSPTASLADEEPLRLLLNPCLDKPEEHFDYDEKEALIKPKTPQAEKSIEVYVLQRQFLVKDRKERLAHLFSTINALKELLDFYQTNKLPELKTMLDRRINELSAFTGPGSEYSGMCRFFVRKFFTENNIKL